MKRRVICIAATALCMAMTSMAYAKEIETTTEDDGAYYTLEVKRKPYDIEKIASVVLGEDYQRDKEYERYWYNEEGTLEDELEHVEYYKTGYYRAYPMFGYSNWIFIWNQNSQKKEMRKIRKRRLTMARS